MGRFAEFDIVMKKKLVLYQSLLRKDINLGTQLAGVRWKVSPVSFENRQKVPWFWGKNVLLVCIYGLNSHLKSSLKSILEKKYEHFSLWSPLCVCRRSNCLSKCLSNCLYSKKPVLLRKFRSCAPVTLILNFHPKFHHNIWVFANLPIYRKLIHGKISLLFSNIFISL